MNLPLEEIVEVLEEEAMEALDELFDLFNDPGAGDSDISGIGK